MSRDTRKSPQARGEGFEPSPPASKAGRLPLADPRSLRSALWESNPPRQLGRLEPLPLGQGHLLKAEGVRVELIRLLRSTRPTLRVGAREAAAIADWLALPFCHQAPVGGIEPPIFGLTGRRLTVWPHRIMSVRTAGFEPAISCSRGTRNTRLSYVLIRERPAGVEPALPPWQGGRLPLHHGRLVGSRIVKDPRAPDQRCASVPGLEPSSPHYESGVFAARSPVLVFQVGPVGIEPTSSGLRDRCITLSATVPSKSARRESNPGHRRAALVAGAYKAPALTAELRASE